jgi:hypothetical protein
MLKEIFSFLIGITVIYVRSCHLVQTLCTDIETIHEALPLRRFRVFRLFWLWSVLWLVITIM